MFRVPKLLIPPRYEFRYNFFKLSILFRASYIGRIASHYNATRSVHFNFLFMQCSVTCGTGIRTRAIECRDGVGAISRDCDPAERPHTEQECKTSVACPTCNCVMSELNSYWIANGNLTCHKRQYLKIHMRYSIS